MSPAGEAPPWRDGAAALGIFALAAAVRAIHLLSIRDIPSFQHLLIDAAAYDAWAVRIAGGAWWGPDAFYQAPAYPYLLAVVYRFIGHEMWNVHVIQLLLGALSCALCFGTARVLFGFGAGLTAGLVLALYPPAIFFGAIVQKTALGLALTSAGLLAVVAFERRQSAFLCALAGALFGLLALTRENALVWLPWIPVWLAMRTREGRSRLVPAAAFVAGAALLLLPAAIHNYANGRTFSLTTSQLGTNFWYGNSPDASGLYVPLVPGRHTPEFESPDATRIAEEALGRPLSRGEVSDYWLGRGLDWVRAEPVAWSKLMVWKWFLTWNAYEIPDTEDLYVYEDWSPALRWSPLHFGLLVPLAAAGLILARRDPPLWARSHFLIWLALVYAAGVSVFLVAARFRFPLVPLLLPFVGLAVVHGASLATNGRIRELRAPLLALAAAAIACNVLLLDRDVFRASSYANFGGIMLREHRLADAERYLEQAESIFAGDPDVQFHLGVLRSEQGRLPEAEAHLRRMLEMEDADYRGHQVLADVLERQGRPEEAAGHRKTARELAPDPAPEAGLGVNPKAESGGRARAPRDPRAPPPR
ncbi:MAG: glycosyltransferase family 39 protein [Proteobacteria bacterium]|nr:glycosyltransferase family 39 protein [Pseudomonadota bacterium]